MDREVKRWTGKQREVKRSTKLELENALKRQLETSELGLR